MNKISKLRLAQYVQLKALIEIHELCEKEGLNYCIVAGTLLGAVRHGGFIPWDSDIDIAMTRKDYSTLVEKFSNFSSYLTFDCDETNDLSTTGFAKIKIKSTSLIERGNLRRRQNADNGIYIDVFPLDEFNPKVIPYSKFIRWIYVLTIRLKAFKAGKRVSSTRFRTVIAYVMNILFIWASREHLITLQKKIICTITSLDSPFVNNINSKYGLKKQFFEKADYFPTCKIKFENNLFEAPRNTSKWLKQIYGDYNIEPEKKEPSLAKYTMDFGNYSYLLNYTEDQVRDILF